MRIVPTNRLLFFTGLILFPSSLLGSLFPEICLYTYALIVLFLCLSIIDALFSITVLRFITVSTDDVFRLSRGQEKDLTLVISHQGKKGRHLRMGLAFPPELSSSSHEKTLILQDPEALIRLLWTVTGRKQGQYILSMCFLESPSHAGFWAIRGTLPLHCDIRVYPDLLSERKALGSLFLSHGMGVHARRMVGKGREFEKLREYVTGDSYEDIHWKATAKRGVPISKVFQVERTQDIYVMIDGSRMSARNAAIFQHGRIQDEKRTDEDSQPSPFPGETILERYITATLTTAMAAEKQGDRFGVGLFADTMLGFVKSSSGKAHYNAVRDLLYTARPHRISPDFTELFTFLGTRIRKRSLLIILTSLDDPVLAETFLKNVHILSRRHLVMVNMLNPASARPLFSTPHVTGINDIYQHLSGHTVWNNLRELEKSLGRQNTGFFLLDNSRLCVELISQYMDIKQRQIL
ncbi:MAG: DUF58 domain-containing protein [Proteobacteria bacterium]|nr:DUF58 domain-containing protein [Pseudomonadota bacterium]